MSTCGMCAGVNRENYFPALASFPVLENNSGDSWCVPRRTSYTFDSICDDACGSSAAGLKIGPPPRSRPKMSVQMGAAHQALCYFYRNPPASSGVKPQPYKDIAKLIQLPNTPAATIRSVVRTRTHTVRPRAAQSRCGRGRWRRRRASWKDMTWQDLRS